MALTLPYTSIETFNAATVHSFTEHNLPHDQLLANDIAVKAYMDGVDASIAGIVSGQFDWTQHLLTTSGYQRFPQGLLVQWTRGAAMSVPGGTSLPGVAISWPIAFSTCFHAIVTGLANAPAPAYTSNSWHSWFNIETFSAISVTVHLLREGTVGSGSFIPLVLGIGI